MNDLRKTERLMRKAQKLAEAMRKQNFSVEICRDKQEAMERVLSSVPQDKSVSCGTSSALIELELPELLKERGYQYIEWNRQTPLQESCDRLEQMMHSDVFVTDIHAVTKKGTLVLSGNTGSQIAAMAFGAGEVIVMAGMNKVCRNERAAMKYARTSERGSNYVMLVNGCVIPGRIRVILAAAI